MCKDVNNLVSELTGKSSAKSIYTFLELQLLHHFWYSAFLKNIN